VVEEIQGYPDTRDTRVSGDTRDARVSGDTSIQEYRITVTVHIIRTGEKVDNRSGVTSQVSIVQAKHKMQLNTISYVMCQVIRMADDQQSK